MNNLKIKISVAQTVGKVWISMKKSSWPHFMPFQAFFARAGHIENMQKFCQFSAVGPWAHFHPVWARPHPCTQVLAVDKRIRLVHVIAACFRLQMARNELILKLDEAVCIRMVSRPKWTQTKDMEGIVRWGSLTKNSNVMGCTQEKRSDLA